MSSFVKFTTKIAHFINSPRGNPPRGNSHKKAFSLIELSIAVLVIGILVIAITSGKYLVKKATILSAQNLTLSSPISSYDFWLEGTTLPDKIFVIGSEDQDCKELKDGILIGGLIIKTANIANPICYANSINAIPAFRFQGNESHMLAENAISDNSGYSVTIFELNEADKDFSGYNAPLLSSSDGTTGLYFGYDKDCNVIYSHSGSDDTSNDAIITQLASCRLKSPKTFILNYSPTKGKELYVDGVLIASSTDTTSIPSETKDIYIGKNYTGQIGEIAINPLPISNSTVMENNNYIATKWKTDKVVSTTFPSCPVEAGIGYHAFAGDDSGVINCNKEGYFGAVKYSCANYAGSVDTTSCVCKSGYSLNNGDCNPASCVYDATYEDIALSGSGTNHNCPAGYYGAIDYSCDGDTYATINSGTCTPATCTTASGTGFTTTPNSLNVAYSATTTDTLSCNETGYSGNITYNPSSCTTQDSVLEITNNCIPTTCSITNTTGFNNKTDLAFTTSESTITDACAAGFKGTPTYTCTSTGEANIAGTCTPMTCTADSSTGFDSRSVTYSTSTSAALPCKTGYSGSITYNPSSCTAANTNKTMATMGSCTLMTCTVSANGFDTRSGVTYSASTSAAALPCKTGYSGSITYNPSSCTAANTNKAMATTGSCTPMTCTVSANGFDTRSGVTYSASANNVVAGCKTGYYGSIIYNPSSCTTQKNLATGSCTLMSCTVSASGFDTRGVTYSVSANNVVAGCKTGYRGSITYNPSSCTTQGSNLATGSCTPMNCTLKSDSWTNPFNDTTIYYSTDAEARTKCNKLPKKNGYVKYDARLCTEQNKSFKIHSYNCEY
jgi:prepilin-type N-terminal cleavage/methylation domain-containing protein